MPMWNRPASAIHLPKFDTQKYFHVIECSKDTLLAACSLFRGSHPKPPARPSDANTHDPYVHSIIS